MRSVIYRRSPGFAMAVDPERLYSLSSYDQQGRKRYVPMPTVIDLNQDSPFVEAGGYNGGAAAPLSWDQVPKISESLSSD